MLRPSAPTFHLSHNLILSHLPYPYVKHAWIQNRLTSAWFTEGECLLVCAILLHIRKAGDVTSYPVKFYRYTYQMLDEIVQNLRNLFGLPWRFLEINCRSLYYHVKMNDNRRVRTLWYTAKNDPIGFWKGRAKWAFNAWIETGSPLVENLMASGELFQYYDSMNEINTTRPQIFSGPTASVANRPVDSVGPQELARRNSMIQGQIDHLQRQKAMVDEVVAAKDETKPGTATQTGNVAGD